MKRNSLLVISLIVLMGAALTTFFLLRSDGQKPVDDHLATPVVSEDEMKSDQIPAASTPEFEFATGKKSAHYVSNMPEHGSILTVAPGEVVINFNFDLSNKSTISVTKDGQEVSTGDLKIDDNLLVMRKAIAPNPGKGLYTVMYDACWPDGSCHDGNFQFGVQ